MYHIKKVSLKNGEKMKEIPVIAFDDPEKAIVAEFLMTDSLLLGEDIKNAIRDEEQATQTWTGNRCSVTIQQSCAVIKDLFAGLYDETTIYPPYEMNVAQLVELMDMWLDVKKHYKG